MDLPDTLNDSSVNVLVENLLCCESLDDAVRHAAELAIKDLSTNPDRFVRSLIELVYLFPKNIALLEVIFKLFSCTGQPLIKLREISFDTRKLILSLFDFKFIQEVKNGENTVVFTDINKGRNFCFDAAYFLFPLACHLIKLNLYSVKDLFAFFEERKNEPGMYLQFNTAAALLTRLSLFYLPKELFEKLNKLALDWCHVKDNLSLQVISTGILLYLICSSGSSNDSNIQMFFSVIRNLLNQRAFSELTSSFQALTSIVKSPEFNELNAKTLKNFLKDVIDVCFQCIKLVLNEKKPGVDMVSTCFNVIDVLSSVMSTPFFLKNSELLVDYFDLYNSLLLHPSWDYEDEKTNLKRTHFGDKLTCFDVGLFGLEELADHADSTQLSKLAMNQVKSLMASVASEAKLLSTLSDADEVKKVKMSLAQKKVVALSVICALLEECAKGKHIEEVLLLTSMLASDSDEVVRLHVILTMSELCSRLPNFKREHLNDILKCLHGGLTNSDSDIVVYWSLEFAIKIFGGNNQKGEEEEGEGEDEGEEKDSFSVSLKLQASDIFQEAFNLTKHQNMKIQCHAYEVISELIRIYPSFATVDIYMELLSLLMLMASKKTESNGNNGVAIIPYLLGILSVFPHSDLKISRFRDDVADFKSILFDPSNFVGLQDRQMNAMLNFASGLEADYAPYLMETIFFYAQFMTSIDSTRFFGESESSLLNEKRDYTHSLKLLALRNMFDLYKLFVVCLEIEPLQKMIFSMSQMILDATLHCADDEDTTGLALNFMIVILDDVMRESSDMTGTSAGLLQFSLSSLEEIAFDRCSAYAFNGIIEILLRYPIKDLKILDQSKKLMKKSIEGVIEHLDEVLISMQFHFGSKLINTVHPSGKLRSGIDKKQIKDACVDEIEKSDSCPDEFYYLLRCCDVVSAIISAYQGCDCPIFSGTWKECYSTNSEFCKEVIGKLETLLKLYPGNADDVSAILLFMKILERVCIN